MSAPATTLSVEQLYGLPGDAMPGHVADVFTTQVQFCPSVHDTFFGSLTGGNIGPGFDGWADWLDSVATALVCSNIARTSLYGFAGTVNRSASDAYWAGQLAGPEGRSVGRQIYDEEFPWNCAADGTTFADYQNSDPKGWAAKLAAYLTTSTFITDVLLKLIASEPNWLDQVNLVYYKLHLLDPSQEQVVVAAWTNANAAAVEQWTNDNYLAKLFTGDEWIGNVNAAIGVTTIESYSKGVWGGTGSTTTYGKAVEQFLGAKPSNLGLTTGASPDNLVVD
jgi:hypothetical protein